eukprot:scaffold7306_cov31-Tisochrysis_lutea.AAC.6
MSMLRQRTRPAFPKRSSCGVPGGATSSGLVQPHPSPQEVSGPPLPGDCEQMRPEPPAMPPRLLYISIDSAKLNQIPR